MRLLITTVGGAMDSWEPLRGDGGSAPCPLARATWLGGSGGWFSTGFGPTGSRRQGEPILLTMRKQRAAVAVGDDGVTRAELDIDEGNFH
jgi:hypothetical protein